VKSESPDVLLSWIWSASHVPCLFQRGTEGSKGKTGGTTGPTHTWSEAAACNGAKAEAGWRIRRPGCCCIWYHKKVRFCFFLLLALAGSCSYGESVELGSLPDAKLTPGATLEVTKDDVCIPGYTKNVRNVPVSVKRRVYEEYGVKYVPRAYEVDHLISLELGGSNSIRNLWPESYGLLWNAHVKDSLEDRLHRLVCDGSITLEAAQQLIATNWIEAYQRYFHTDSPIYARESRARTHYRRRN
jgi:hypothetical protein